MSTLGHVLFLLPFSRDFVCSGCITSFLTRSEARRRRKSATGDSKKGNFTCSQRIAVIHWVEATHFAATHFAAIRFAVIRFAVTLCDSRRRESVADFVIGWHRTKCRRWLIIVECAVGYRGEQES